MSRYLFIPALALVLGACHRTTPEEVCDHLLSIASTAPPFVAAKLPNDRALCIKDGNESLKTFGPKLYARFNKCFMAASDARALTLCPEWSVKGGR
jgi:hypothetical protein